MRYRFARCVLDADRLELERDGRPVKIQPKALGVLLFLLQNPDRVVSKDELLDAVWPGVSTTEASLTRAISLARRAVGDVDGELISTLWGRGYRLAAAVDVEDETAVERPPTPAEPEVEQADRRPRLRVVATVALALVVVATVWLALPPSLEEPERVPVPAPTSPQPAIAVLPFADMTPSADEPYFSDGLSEEILNELTHVPGLRVVARTSSFAFRGHEGDVREIGEQLSVSCVLEGSVRRDRDQVRITAQLVDARSGLHLWSRNFDREFAGLFRVQEEIARAIVTSMQTELGAGGLLEVAGRRAPHPRAYEEQLRSRYFAALATDEAQQLAIDHLRRAIEIDPDYSEAHASLAAAYSTLWANWNTDSGDALLALAEGAARRALALDPRSAAAHAALGNVHKGRREWQKAEASFLRSLEVNPGYPDAHHDYASLLMMRGRIAEAAPYVRRAVELDPLSAKLYRGLGRLYLYSGDYPRAVASLHRALELNPEEPHSPRLLANAYQLLERPVDASEAYLLSFPPSARPFVRAFGRLLGDDLSLKALLWLDVAASGDRCRGSPLYTSYALAHLGERDWMLECLERAIPRHLWYVRVEPVFDPYREDPRFQAIIDRAGFGDR